VTNENEIDNIRINSNIVSIISSYIPLTQKGKNYFGVCPFHEDHSPSMSVSEEKQIYKCFSCGAAGNVFTFVSEYENVNFLEAVKIVADKSGLKFDGHISSVKSKPQNVEYEIMNLALKFYQNNLNTKEGILAKNYLEKRGLNEEAIKEFDLGLALDGDALYQYLIKKYSPDKLLELGLINRNGTYINDIFKRRIIFPIHNLEGLAVGFTARIYEDSAQAKYINSKESTIFKKGEVLFNYHRAKSEIKRLKEVIIVEGNMDAIRLYLNGVKNVIALMGTSLTKEQVIILKNLRARIILMLDNDSAGEAATIQNGEILEKNDLPPYIVRLSGEKDPDSYILKNGVDAIKSNLKNPISFLDFKLNYYKKNKDLTKTTELVSYVKDILNSVKDIQDDLTRELTISSLSKEYNIPLDLLKSELDKITSSKSIIKEVQKRVQKKISKYDSAAINIIYFMINDSKYIDLFEQELGFFKNKTYRSIVSEIIYYYKKHSTIDMASFLTYIGVKDYIYDDVMTIIKEVKIDELDEILFKDFIKIAKKEALNNEIKELKEKIKNEFDNEEKTKLAEKLLELKKGCVENE